MSKNSIYRNRKFCQFNMDQYCICTTPTCLEYFILVYEMVKSTKYARPVLVFSASVLKNVTGNIQI